MGTSLVQREPEERNIIPRSWILLDTCSTHCVGCNKDLIHDIRKCTKDEVLCIETNGGSLIYEHVGICSLAPVKMFYNPNSIANVLSLSMVADIPGVKIVMDSEAERSIKVIFGDETNLVFKECKDGLYFFDTNTARTNPTNAPVNDYSSYNLLNSHINSIENNKKIFSKKQVQKAIEARQMQRILCWPSTDYFKYIVRNNMLQNCDI